MDADSVKNAIKAVKEETVKGGKKFKQSIDLVIVTKQRSSKSEEPIDATIYLQHPVREVKTCAFVDKDMVTQASGVFSTAILKDDFAKYDKKTVRKLVKTTDFFFAEATIMAAVAAKFGKSLTAANKMPNPKTNTIITPSSDIRSQAEKAKTAVRLSTKKNNFISVKVGDQTVDDQMIIDNVNSVYSHVKSSLLAGDAGIKHVFVKPTMGKKAVIV